MSSCIVHDLFDRIGKSGIVNGSDMSVQLLLLLRLPPQSGGIDITCIYNKENGHGQLLGLS